MKGYYPFKMFGELYRLGTCCKTTVECGNIYATAAKGEGGFAIMISHYTDDDGATDECEILLDIKGGAESYSLSVLDAERDAEVVGTVKCGEKITLLPNTVCLLKSVK
jgi:hypothetical protein